MTDAAEEERVLLIKATLISGDVDTVYVTLTAGVTRSIRLLVFTMLTTGKETEQEVVAHKSPRVLFTPCTTAKRNTWAVDSVAVMPVMVCVACTTEDSVVEIGEGLGGAMINWGDCVGRATGV